jgi:demethylmenaquinone methyltransferase / 2-methoxy-6-polyprenyl-1,4-benzoquinol methylase
VTVIAGPTSHPPTGEAPQGQPAHDDHDDIATPIPRPGVTVTPLARSTRTTAGARGGNLRPEGEITAMFDEIAPVYDRLNTIMTLGFDRRWRAAAVAASRVGAGDAAIDVAAGTGKLAGALADRVGPFGRVAAVDLSPGMVARGRSATSDLVQLEFVVGNALALPFEDGRFDAATIAFGLRNLSDFGAGFREMRRVVRPGGRVVCLELTVPRPRWWGRVYQVGFGRLARLAGSIAGRREMYAYLPASLVGFPDAEQLARLMVEAGLVDVSVRRFGLGAVALHVGRAPG